MYIYHIFVKGELHKNIASYFQKMLKHLHFV